jgi:hypothetical protein
MNFKQLFLFGLIAGSLVGMPMVSAMETTMNGGADAVSSNLESLGAQSLADDHSARAEGFTHYVVLGARYYKVKLSERDGLPRLTGIIIVPMTVAEMKVQFPEGKLFGLGAAFNEQPDATIACGGVALTAVGKSAGWIHWKTGFGLTGLAILGNRAYEMWQLYGFGKAARGASIETDGDIDGANDNDETATGSADDADAAPQRQLPTITYTFDDKVKRELISWLTADARTIANKRNQNALSKDRVLDSQVLVQWGQRRQGKKISEALRLRDRVEIFYASTPDTVQNNLNALTDTLGFDQIQIDASASARRLPNVPSISVPRPGALRIILKGDLEALLTDREMRDQTSILSFTVQINDEVKTISDDGRLKNLVQAFYRSNRGTVQQNLDKLTNALGLERIQATNLDAATSQSTRNRPMRGSQIQRQLAAEAAAQAQQRQKQ